MPAVATGNICKEGRGGSLRMDCHPMDTNNLSQLQEERFTSSVMGSPQNNKRSNFARCVGRVCFGSDGFQCGFWLWCTNGNHGVLPKVEAEILDILSLVPLVVWRVSFPRFCTIWVIWCTPSITFLDQRQCFNEKFNQHWCWIRSPPSWADRILGPPAEGRSGPSSKQVLVLSRELCI